MCVVDHEPKTLVAAIMPSCSRIQESNVHRWWMNLGEERAEAWSVHASSLTSERLRGNGTWGRGNVDGKGKRKMKNRNKRENGYWSYKDDGVRV